MDIPGAENKAISASDVQNKADTPTTQKAVSQLMWEYFFPGGGVWKPMTIKAPNREQAEEIHRGTRVPVEAKAEETKTNND